MTITLNLKPEVEASLQAQARATGMDLDDFLLRLVEGAAGSPEDWCVQAAHDKRADAIRKMAEFGEKHRLSLGDPVTRELLQDGHRS